MQTELARRVTQLATGAASTAEAAINRAIRWTNRQGSYTFQLSVPVGVLPMTVSGLSYITTPTDFDSGKAFLLLNNSGTAVKQAPVSGLGDTQNYNTIANTDFDQYVLVAYNSGATMFLYPTVLGSGILTLIYHRITADITGAGLSNLPRDFDDLVVDLAEAEEKRIYDVGDAWSALISRCQDQIKVLLDNYKTQTIETGLDTEAQALIGEKAKVGRD
jgi:hypothetical protein